MDPDKLTRIYNKSPKCWLCIKGGFDNIIYYSESHCPNCIEFNDFQYAFCITSRFNTYAFPPPIVFSSKNKKFFLTLLRVINENLQLRKKKLLTDRLLLEVKYFKNFISGTFRGGQLSTILSGKTSLIRNSILGFKTTGMRMTLIIDCCLDPDTAIIPASLYDHINMETPYVIINRAPSINNKCIYTCRVYRNPDLNDSTIHITSFITEGLHADQDGDELTVFYFNKQNALSPADNTLSMAIMELKQFSWRFGTRFDINYRPRYFFTQFLKYFLYKHDAYFKKASPLWDRLVDDSRGGKCDKIMNLGCSIKRREVDEFIKFVLHTVKTYKYEMTPMTDILLGIGDVAKVVASKTKGTNVHIKTYLSNLYHDKTKNDFMKAAKNSFNKYIINSNALSAAGNNQFQLLNGLNTIYSLGNDMYAHGSPMIENLGSDLLYANVLFNPVAVDWTLFDDDVKI